VNGAVYFSHLNLFAAIARTSTEIVIPTVVDIFPHDKAREAIINEALGTECDYLLFLDSDMEAPTNTFHKLLSTMSETGAAMVAGHAYRRGYPYTSTWTKVLDGQVFQVDSDKNGRSSEIDSCGLAINLIDLRFVRTHLKPPYFFQGQMLASDGSHCFIWEDAFFCKRVRETGGKIWAEPKVRAGHLGNPVMINDENVVQLRAEHIGRTVVTSNNKL
jgi:hypothetical protein